MKIHILPCKKKFQPEVQRFVYPAHNNDFGIEQDFLLYLKNNPELLVDNPSKADWHYLPIYWTRWHVEHDYAKRGRPELQEELDRIMIDDNRTFTICQYADGPLSNIGLARQFLGSRKSENGFDAPLLLQEARRPFLLFPRKKYKACFLGRYHTHTIRSEMHAQLEQRKDVYLYNGDMGKKSFDKKLLQSYISLCPRGYGGGSFRLIESMQLGVVPFLIGDVDTRPFKQWIPWNEISFYADDVNEIEDIIDGQPPERLVEMGEKSTAVYNKYLAYQKWCPFVLKTLETQS